MNDFTELFFKLDQTNKTSDKVEALVAFLQKATPLDRLWMMAFFTGRQPKRTINSRLLREWVIEEAKLPLWLLEETYHVVGDLAETLALLLPPSPQPQSHSLSQWMEWIQSLSQDPLEEKKRRLLLIWRSLSAQERLVFNKVLVGGFRLGVSQNLLIRALAQVTRIESAVLAHRLMGKWHPQTTDPHFFTSPDESNPNQPYPFCLAYPLDRDLEQLGAAKEWCAEWKWDGMRAQLLRRQGLLTLWSRGEEIVNDRFPELFSLESALPDGCALDGELLACIDEKPLSFQALQQRIGKKKATSTLVKQVPVIFLAYDLLEWRSQDWRAYPLEQRRQQLEELIQSLPTQNFLRISPLLAHDSWEELRQKQQDARSEQVEGIMLKRWSSPYHAGRQRGNWWKWKVEALTVDGVLVYAQKGHGWRANVYSDYTFAVWNEGQLIPFAKAYSGLTKKELADVDRFIKAHTLEKFGPVRAVTPQLVFEIAFEGIQLSKRHKSGVAVRFPRIHRWRHDKKPEEADTLDTLKALLHAAG